MTEINLADLMHTPPTSTVEQSGMLTLADIDRLIDLLRNEPMYPDIQVVSPWYAANYERLERRVRNQIIKRRAAQRRLMRWKKIRERQRRAAQRRHHRGER